MFKNKKISCNTCLKTFYEWLEKVILPPGSWFLGSIFPTFPAYFYILIFCRIFQTFGRKRFLILDPRIPLFSNYACMQEKWNWAVELKARNWSLECGIIPIKVQSWPMFKTFYWNLAQLPLLLTILFLEIRIRYFL